MFKRLKTFLLPVAILAAVFGGVSVNAATLPETRVGGYQLFDAASRQAETPQVPESQQATGFSWYDTASECSVAAKSTTVLGENMAKRTIPFAEATGARTLPFGTTAEEWAKMTPQQRWKLNDGALRTRINEGDNFRYIGQDPYRSPAQRTQFDLTRSELLRLQERNVPYETVSPSEVQSVLGRP